ncbi:hypothetical protein D3C87_1332180 [compost metagenome]
MHGFADTSGTIGRGHLYLLFAFPASGYWLHPGLDLCRCLHRRHADVCVDWLRVHSGADSFSRWRTQREDHRYVVDRDLLCGVGTWCRCDSEARQYLSGFRNRRGRRARFHGVDPSPGREPVVCLDVFAARRRWSGGDWPGRAVWCVDAGELRFGY